MKIKLHLEWAEHDPQADIIVEQSPRELMAQLPVIEV